MWASRVRLSRVSAGLGTQRAAVSGAGPSCRNPTRYASAERAEPFHGSGRPSAMARAMNGAVPSASAATTNLRDGHSIGGPPLVLRCETVVVLPPGFDHDHVGGSPSRGPAWSPATPVRCRVCPGSTGTTWCRAGAEGSIPASRRRPPITRPHDSRNANVTPAVAAARRLRQPCSPTQEVASCNPPGRSCTQSTWDPPCGQELSRWRWQALSHSWRGSQALTVRGTEYLHAARIVPSSVTFQPTMPALASYDKPALRLFRFHPGIRACQLN